jgi:hypothetical protein
MFGPLWNSAYSNIYLAAAMAVCEWLKRLAAHGEVSKSDISKSEVRPNAGGAVDLVAQLPADFLPRRMSRSEMVIEEEEMSAAD